MWALRVLKGWPARACDEPLSRRALLLDDLGLGIERELGSGLSSNTLALLPGLGFLGWSLSVFNPLLQQAAVVLVVGFVGSEGAAGACL